MEVALTLTLTLNPNPNPDPDPNPNPNPNPNPYLMQDAMGKRERTGTSYNERDYAARSMQTRRGLRVRAGG